MDKTNLTNSLKVSEFFHSIQGEGPTTGYPSWFLRLTACNLDCPWCDTTEVWRKGVRMLFEDIPEHWLSTSTPPRYSRDRYLEGLQRGDHLIITGGEPMLQQDSIVSYLQYLTRYKTCNIANLYVEIETNGTILPDGLTYLVNQWNCSPKLSNSAMPRDKRYKPGVLGFLNSFNNVIFKFVIEDETDLEEIRMDFIDPGLIDRDKVWLMPMASDRKELEERSLWLADLCKLHGFRFSNRLQIQIWNRVVGV